MDGEIFYTLKEAQIVIEGWRQHYNTVRPHSSLGYKPPAPEAILWPAAQSGPASPATPGRSAKTRHALTLNPDHLMGQAILLPLHVGLDVRRGH